MSSQKQKEPKNRSLLSTDTVAVYLREIGRVPLLEDSEEIIYGQQVQRMMSLLREKEKLEQDSVRVISQKEWATAVGLSEGELKQVLAQGQQAKRKMIEANLRLVVAPSLTGSEADRQKISETKLRISGLDSRRKPGFGARSRKV